MKRINNTIPNTLKILTKKFKKPTKDQLYSLEDFSTELKKIHIEIIRPCLINIPIQS